ncbi:MULTISPECIES: YtrH family sporulation protein [Sedimentibacter]|uniref:YtrH family sporulation protein n=1 Tax=Sedimentibacter hydroxybenzoicus DSM 7310 TaxID=1123245 RepID=A0A974BGU3_SEDHY|nr:MULTISPECIES: YtrH family sporulation protein [Sedimentibacter]NYB72885.1 YtrH family sporulation protein [Sedimentibacter hydroxybenzoicus DSM 7310]
MSSFYSSIVQNFLISFGVVIGASLFSGIGAIITNHPPYKIMMQVASSIKIWAIAASLGGTFSSFAVIEKGIFDGEIKTLAKQALYILISLSGANIGYEFIRLLQRCGYIWGR